MYVAFNFLSFHLTFVTIVTPLFAGESSAPSGGKDTCPASLSKSRAEPTSLRVLSVCSSQLKHKASL